MSQIRKGRLIGLFRERGSGLGMVAIDDDLRGKVLVPCEGNPTSRAFDEAFGGFIIDGHSTDNSAIAGEPIYYTLDSIGILETFTPEDRAPVELVKEYDAAKRGGRGSCTDHGFLPTDHPLYSIGPIIAGRHILAGPKKKPHENN